MATRPTPTPLTQMLSATERKRTRDDDTPAVKRVAAPGAAAHYLLKIEQALAAARLALVDCIGPIATAQENGVDVDDIGTQAEPMLVSLTALHQTVRERRDVAAWERVREILTYVDPRDECALTNALSHVIRNTATEKDRRVVWAVCKDIFALFPPK